MPYAYFKKKNLYNNNLITNLRDINYTDGEQKLKGFKPITEPFCGNIMLVKINRLYRKKLMLKARNMCIL